MIEQGIAYLTSEYPKLSHAFIEREVAALRRLSVDVKTYTVRRASESQHFSPETRSEEARTTPLLGRPLRSYLAAHARLLVSSPRAWLVGAVAASRTGSWSPRPRLWQLFYFVEAVLLHDDMRGHGLRHLHVHFANNGADVARLVVAIGAAVDGSGHGWRWSFAMHGPTEFEDVVRYDLAAKVRSASAVACISDYARGRLAELVAPLHHEKLAIVRMSVSGAAYPAMSARRERRDHDALRVLFVGRLVEEKAADVLVRAAGILVDRGVSVDVVVIGGGPERERLDEDVSALGLEGVVHLLGPKGQSELPHWYEWADVFCLPSRAEGVPVVLMEALATELPVVTTRIAGIPELVQDGVHGFLLEPGDPASVADALGELAAAPSRRSTMGRAGRQHVLEEFDPDLNARRLLELLALAPGDRDNGDTLSC